MPRKSQDYEDSQESMSSFFIQVAKIDCGKIHVCKKLYRAYVDVIIYTMTLNNQRPDGL